MAIELFFWTSAILILYTYLAYPLVIMLLHHFFDGNKLHFDQQQLPEITILIPAFNEENCIEKKIISVLNSNYPGNLISVWVISDASTDQTHEIVTGLQIEFKQVKLFINEERIGKPEILNTFVTKVQTAITILTDANVMFTRETLYELVKHFKNEKIGLVDSIIRNTNNSQRGIAFQESSYLTYEALIKYGEGKIWGCMQGPFGACYALRTKLFRPIAPNFLVDDFYINLNVLAAGYKSLSEPKAEVFEEVSTLFSEEFRRKKRIAAGNFQNLFHFKKMLLPYKPAVAFTFWSHKVLRWFGAVLLAILSICLAFLYFENTFYHILSVLYLLSIVIASTDLLLLKTGIQLPYLRFFTHFYGMNIALLIGFYNYLKGIHTNVWQPTKRNQAA